MLFRKLKLNYFGRFQNREIELKPGINLIYGDNEAGKSTIHSFIRGMLFGIERLRGRGAASKEDIYTRYLPWDYPGAYSGSMDIKIGEKEYRLQRSFHANDKSFAIVDLSTGREVKLKEGLISELVTGLTETTYKNTISIEQLKASTDTELAGQVRNYITNLSIAKSKEVNVAKAVSLLTDQRKQLEALLNTTVLKTLQSEIEDGIVREEKMDQLTLQLRELIQKEQSLDKQKLALSSSEDQEATKIIEQLPAITEKYRSYRELIRQENSLGQQEQELKAKITVWEQEQQSEVSLRKHIDELQKLGNRLTELDKNDLELQYRKDRLNKRARIHILVSILPGCAVALIVGVVTGFKPYGLILLSLFFAIGMIGYIILNRLHAKKQKKFEADYNEAKQNKAVVQAQIQDILNTYGITHVEELSARQVEVIRNSYALKHSKEQLEEHQIRRAELDDSRDVIYDAIMKYMQYFIQAEELTDITMQRLQEVIKERRLETAGNQARISNELESMKLRIEKLRWDITSLEGNEEKLLRNKEKYCDLELKQKENTIHLEAVKLALASIQELSSDIHDSFGQQLNTSVIQVISEITDQKYKDLKIDEKLEVKVDRSGDYVLLERLSAGTIDQIYFALRMAVADLLLGKDEVPLLLDDSFVLYDEMRVKAALKQLSLRKQVILFTCHKREQQLMDELGLSYHLVELTQG